MRKTTLLDRARAASKARGYEDTDSEDDVKGRRGKGNPLQPPGCGCPQCKPGGKGCGHGAKKEGLGFGSSTARRTLLSK